MRRSARDQIASVGKSQVVIALHELQGKYQLTDIEMMQAMAEWQQGVLKYLLRFERHGNYETPAGLE